MEWDQNQSDNGWNTADRSDFHHNRLRRRSHTAILVHCRRRTRMHLHNSPLLLHLPTMLVPTIKEACPTPQVRTLMCRNILAITPQFVTSDSIPTQTTLGEVAPLPCGLQTDTINIPLPAP